MDKGKIRVALAALSVTGLLAGVSMTGCKSAGSCTGGAQPDKMQQQSTGSCSAGSCSGTMAPKPEKPAGQ